MISDSSSSDSDAADQWDGDDDMQMRAPKQRRRASFRSEEQEKETYDSQLRAYRLQKRADRMTTKSKDIVNQVMFDSIEKFLEVTQEPFDNILAYIDEATALLRDDIENNSTFQENGLLYADDILEVENGSVVFSDYALDVLAHSLTTLQAVRNMIRIRYMAAIDAMYTEEEMAAFNLLVKDIDFYLPMLLQIRDGFEVAKVWSTPSTLYNFEFNMSETIVNMYKIRRSAWKDVVGVTTPKRPNHSCRKLP